ncbi:MAG: hypothetical protein R2720_00990 [Candidatus Nanopelagicales bacterium]
MVSQTYDITTPKEWKLLTAEARTARLVLDVIDTESNVQDQALWIWSHYRDYSQSEAARAVGIGTEADRKVTDAKNFLRVAVVQSLLGLADFDRVTDNALRDLKRVARLDVKEGSR